MKKLVFALFLGISTTVSAILPFSCDSVFRFGVICPPEKPFSNCGRCFSCDDDVIMEIARGQEKDFDRCQNRIKILHFSVLKKECPSDKPIQTLDGKCISCDELNGQLVPDCSICPNMMMSLDRNCFSCDAIMTGAYFSKEECSKCPNRKWDTGTSENTQSQGLSIGWCALKECPDKTHRIENGDCVDPVLNITGPLYGTDPTYKEILSRKIREYPQDVFEN